MVWDRDNIPDSKTARNMGKIRIAGLLSLRDNKELITGDNNINHNYSNNNNNNNNNNVMKSDQHLQVIGGSEFQFGNTESVSSNAMSSGVGSVVGVGGGGSSGSFGNQNHHRSNSTLLSTNRKEAMYQISEYAMENLKSKVKSVGYGMSYILYLKILSLFSLFFFCVCVCVSSFDVLICILFEVFFLEKKSRATNKSKHTHTHTHTHTQK